MAKTKSVYVKLGEKSRSFYDPTTLLKVLPGQVVELNDAQKTSKLVIKALRNSALEKVSEDDALEALEKTKEGVKGNDDIDLAKMTKAELKSKVIELSPEYGSNENDEDLDSLKKDELIELVEELLEGE